MTKTDKNTTNYKGFVTISGAAKLLGVSIDTVRRWEKAGKISAERLDGKNRYFRIEELENHESRQLLSSTEVARLLDVSTSTVRRLEKDGRLIPSRDEKGRRTYERSAVLQYAEANLDKHHPGVQETIEEAFKDLIEKPAEELVADTEGSIAGPGIVNGKIFRWSLAVVPLVILLLFLPLIYQVEMNKQQNKLDSNYITEDGLSIRSDDLHMLDSGLVKNLNSEYVRGYFPGSSDNNLAILPITTEDIENGAIEIDDLSKEIRGLLERASEQVAGYAGSDGANGADGAQGPQGMTGPAGSQGPAGAQGLSGPPGGTTIAVEVGDATATATLAVMDFSASDFNIFESPANEANVSIDYSNSGITRRTAAETISGNWTFTNGTWQANTISAQYGGTGVNGSAAGNGRLLIGNGSGYTLANLTAASGINIVNGSGGITISNTLGTSIGNSEIEANAIALGTQTTGTYANAVTAGNGIGVTGVAGEGWSPTVSVLYGSTANTSVQGNTTITCASGSGNLTGGGNVITLGSGGTCSAITTAANPTFSTVTLSTLSMNGDSVTDLSGTGLIVTAGALQTTLGTSISNSEIDSDAVSLGAQTVGNYVQSITAGAGITGDVASESGVASLAIGAGNGISVAADSVAVAVQATKGLEVDVNGLSLVDCASGQILKYNGSNQWACASDNDTGGGGGISDGDKGDLTVSGSGSVWTIDNGVVTNTKLQNSSIGLVYSGNVTGDASVSLGGTLNVGFSATPSFTSVSASTFTGNLSGNVTGNADTATAFAANPADCLANQFATTIATNGNLTCAALTDGDVPNTITVDLAAAATSLASNPADCTAGQYAHTIAASGALTCAQVAEGEVSGIITDVIAGTGLTGGGTSGSLTVNIGAGNGISVATDSISVAVQSSKGLEVDGNGVSLIDCSDGQILKYNGSNQWACAADNSGAGSQTLQQTYDQDSNGSNAIIGLTSDDGGVFVRDAAVSIGGNLFAIQNNAGSTSYLAVTTSGVSVAGDVTATTFIGALTGNASTASALFSNPTDCTVNEFATAIAANGNLACNALTDADVPNSITISSSGSVDDGALSANITKLGSSIQNAEVDDNLTISSTGSVADGALSSNVTLLGATITKDEITSGGVLGFTWADSEVSDALTVSSSGSVDDGALSVNVTKLGSSIQNAEVDDDLTISASGSVADGALSSNVTKLGSSIDINTETTGNLLANRLQNAATDLGGADVTVNLSNTNSTFNTNLTLDGSVTAASFIGALTGNASTASALAADPGDCSSPQVAVGIVANGTATCLSLTDAYIPDTLTIGASSTVADGALSANVTKLGSAIDLNTAEVAGQLQANKLQNAAADLGAATVTVDFSNNNGVFNTNLITDGTINTSEGSIQTAGSTRITNAGVLQNVSADTGILTSGTLGAARGGTGVNGSSAANGSLLIGNGSGYTLGTLTEGSGISIANAAGSITVASSLGTSISNSEIDANAVALGTQTSGNYVASLGALTGLSSTGSGEGSTPTLEVLYGSTASSAVQGNTQLTVSAGAGLSGGSTITLGSGGTATLSVTYGSTSNTAVQGNTTLTCPSGNGNLTGGGGTITLGSGGSCGAISTNSAVSFSSSVTTPIVQNAGSLSIGTTATAGADDILFSTAGGEVVRILENGDLRFEKGTNDVTFAVAAPGAPATYTFSGTSGTVLTNSNYSGSLDAAYVNTAESPAAGDIAGSFNSGLTINNDAVTTSKIANSNVTNAKLANSSLTVTAGTGLSGGGSVALGASTSLSVQYGSLAGTAVQGNTTITCASGSGNLSGGGNAITLGTGGTCNAISTNNAVSFSTSVTTPLVTNAGAMTLQTTGLNDLTLASGSTTINLNAATLKTTASLGIDMNSGSNTVLSVVNSGSGTASISTDGGATIGNALTVSAGGFNVTGNSSITGTLSGLTGLTVASGGANITGDTTVNGAVIVGNTFTNTTGAIRWTGTDFQGYDGATWVSLTTGGGGGGSPAKLMSTFEVVGFNQGASATTVLFPIQATAATTVATSIAGTADTRMPSSGSIRACSIVSSAAVTAGTVSVRFRKNGVAVSTTNYCQLSTTNTRVNSQEISSTEITFAAGDTIGVQLVSATLVPTTLDHNVTFTVEFGSATAGSAFTNGGNSFGAAASLGTADNFALNLKTNNTNVLSLATSGLATFSGAVTTSGALTVSAGGASITGGLNLNSSGITNTGTITGVGANITGTGTLTVASGGAGNLVLDSASNILGIAATDTSLQRSSSGTFTIDLNDNTVTTLAVNNTGVGSTDLNLVDGTLQTAGTTRLTNAGALQNITGLTVSSGGASIAGGALITGNSTLGGSSTDRLTIVSQILGNSPLVFQGATDNGFATTFSVTDPTANNTITIPNASGTLVLDSRTIQTAANSGLSGGGNLSGDLGLSLDINNLNAINTTSNSDYIAVYDSNTSSVKKVSRSDFLQGVIGALVYKGTWNATTNTPVLSDATGSNGDVYVVSVGGTRDLGSGNISFSSGDFIIHNGTLWEVAPSSSDVASVFGRTGAVTAQGGDYTAAQVTNTPAGTLAATNVQAAINELDSEKLGSLNGLTATSQTFVNDANITISSAGSAHTLGWSGQLSVARGGTGAASFTSNGVIYGNAAGALQVTAAGTSGQLLVANASGVPVFVPVTGDISLSAAGLAMVTADSVTLGTDTTGNFVAAFGGLTGLSTTGNSGEGSTPTLSVTYGTSANTAVQGSVSLTCATGTGNLSGGGTVITLGSGGTCAGISIINNPTFTSSVTTPTITSASSLTLVSGGGSDILLDSASGIVSLADDETTIQRVAAGTLSINLSDTANTILAITNSGAGTASLSVEAGASFGGNVNTTGVYQTNGTSGLTNLNCTTGQYVGNATVLGGIVTAGACEDDAGLLSDQRLKENVVELDDSILGRIKDVRTVNFDFKCNDAEYAELNLSCKRQTGVIAQELAEVFPELVYQGEDGFNRVRYDALNIYTLKAISELVKSMDQGSVSFNALAAQAIESDRIVAGLEVITPKVTTDELKTNSITASTGDDVTVGLADSGKLVIKNKTGEVTVSIDGSGNAFFAGEITAGKFAGLDYEEQLDSINARLVALENSKDSSTTSAETNTGAVDESGEEASMDSIVTGSLTVEIDLIVKGALIVEGPTTFREMARFESDVTIAGQVTFNNDTAGYVSIEPGQTTATVRFTNPKAKPPVITLSLGEGKFARYSYRNVTESSFEIVLAEPAAETLKFSWIAIQTD